MTELSLSQDVFGELVACMSVGFLLAVIAFLIGYVLRFFLSIFRNV